LPSEQEWETAARGLQGCEYPWCGELEDDICNRDTAGLGRTSTVGLFPRSRQAGLGLEDLSGNVFEWCDSLYEPGGDDAAVPRGGAFVNGTGYLRASYRDGDRPEIRDQAIGFRCVLAPRRQP
jgi:formylglycine-generating enzyme required for sulfatase activity